MSCAHKTEFRVESASGEVVFGFVVVGIPESQFLELKAKFPDERFKGQNPKLKQAVKQDITKKKENTLLNISALDLMPKPSSNVRQLSAT